MDHLACDHHSLIWVSHFFCDLHFAEEETDLEGLRNLPNLLANHVDRDSNPGPFDSRACFLNQGLANYGLPAKSGLLSAFCK